MPSKTYRDFHASQDIPFPEVPKSVIGKKTVTEQVDEMRLYFKAWAEQNTRIRYMQFNFSEKFVFKDLWFSTVNVFIIIDVILFRTRHYY